LELVCLAFYDRSKLNKLHLVSVGIVLKLNYNTCVPAKVFGVVARDQFVEIEFAFID